MSAAVGCLCALTALATVTSARAASTTVVSRVGAAGPLADGDVSELALSANGRFVAFVSPATNLGGPGGLDAVYLKDTETGALTVVSRASDTAGGASANAESTDPSVSADGRYVSFASSATNLGAGVVGTHVYVRDTQTATTTTVDRATGTGAPLGGFDPVISANGRFVVFRGSQDIYSGGTTGSYQAYLRDTTTDTTELVSRASGAGGAIADDSSGSTWFGAPGLAITADGRYVAFVSAAANLTAEANAGHDAQVFLRDRNTAQTTLVSREGSTGVAGDGSSHSPSIAANGTVAFESDALNLGSDKGGVFARALAGPTLVTSREPGPAGAIQYAGSGVALSADDGALLAWVSSQDVVDNLPPGLVAGGNVHRRRLASGDQEIVAATDAGAPLDSSYGPLAISADGSRIAFLSRDAASIDPAAPSTIQVLLRDATTAVPQATAAPSIAGSPRAGRVLTCLSGDWSGFPTVLWLRWLRDGAAIAGATAPTYAVGAGDVTHELRCEVTATNGTPATATSAPVAVDAATPVPAGAFEFLGMFGTEGYGGPGVFSTSLNGVAIAPDGNIVVSDRGGFSGTSLELYTPTGGFIRALATEGYGAGQIRYVSRIAVAGVGDVIASSPAIARFTQDGYALGSSSQRCDLDLNPVEALATDTEGTTYLGGRNDSNGPQIVVCDRSGTVLRSFAVPDAQYGVRGLAMGTDGALYALVNGTTDVQVVVLDPNSTGALGTVLRRFPVDNGLSLAVGADGSVWVGGQHVTKYASEGTRLTSFGSSGSSPGQFFSVGSLAVAGDGTIVVADGLNGRVERFREVAGSDPGPGPGPAPEPGEPLPGPTIGGGNIVNIDVTPPVLEVVSGPTAGQIKAGNPAVTVRCDESCTVTVGGELRIVRRTTARRRARPAAPRAHRQVEARRAAVKKKKKKPGARGKPLPKLGPYKRPRKTVTSAVTAAADIGPATATLAAGVASSVRPAIDAAARGELLRAAAAGSFARLTFEIVAADAAGNAVTKTVEMRIVLR